MQAAMIMRLFKHWNLTEAEQTEVLGLAQTGEASLQNFRNGQVIAEEEDVRERVRQLLAVHGMLRTLFPHNRDLVYKWMGTQNRAFDNRTPLAVVGEHGAQGLAMICAYLTGALGS